MKMYLHNIYSDQPRKSFQKIEKLLVTYDILHLKALKVRTYAVQISVICLLI